MFLSKTGPARVRATTAQRARRQSGMTLIELAVTMTLAAILLKLALPGFSVWLRNSQVRTVSDTLQNGLRLAQAESVRLSRQTVFFLTNSSVCATATAAAGGSFWAIRTVPLLTGEAAASVQCGNVSDVASGVTIAGPTAVCFNSLGRQVANASTGITGATCTLDASGRSTYQIASSGTGSELRPLTVTVSLGGQIRQCDPARTLSSSALDGCPAS